MGFGDAVAAALNYMRYERKVYKDYLPDEAKNIANNLVVATKDLWPDVQDSVLELLRREIPREAPHAAVWWYSVLIVIKKDVSIFLEFVRYVRAHRDAFSANTQYYLWYQLYCQRFTSAQLDDKEQDGRRELWMFYREIVGEFAQLVDADLLRRIPPEARDDGFVLVVTEQVLNQLHSPTKVAFDCCRILMEGLHKKILLINDAEVTSNIGMVPLWERYVAQYLPRKEVKAEWKGITIPYWQCENNMPDIDTLKMLLQEIRKLAPGRIITIGKGGILANLASRMVPTLTIGLTSDLEYTCAKYQVMSRQLQDADIAMLSSLNLQKDHVIYGTFSFGEAAQTDHVTRKEIGLPENAFVIAVIGWRLDAEVTEEFLLMLERVLTEDMYVAFWGCFDTYDTLISHYGHLQEQSRYFGICEDVLSRLEVCDLFVNPQRQGGGTSAVDALFKGVPVVTVDYGDVAINVGEEFCVANYGQMGEQIKRYHDDRAFYEQMSLKAKARADRMLDTDREFVRVLEEMDRREQQEREIKALEES